jgi:DNA-binding GntR family transcriptional regulator
MNNRTVTRSRALHQQVFELVLAELRNGDFPPGTRITEEGLAKRFGVLRSPIRAALAQLLRQETLRARLGGGYVVPSPSTEEVDQTVAVRLFLEPPGVRMAAEECGPSQVEQISRAIRRAERAIAETQPAALVVALEEVRSAILGGISNRVLSRLISDFGGHLHYIRTMTLWDRAVREEVVAKLVGIRDAIAAHDGARAEALWAAYIGQSRELLNGGFRDPERFAEHASGAMA